MRLIKKFARPKSASELSEVIRLFLDDEFPGLVDPSREGPMTMVFDEDGSFEAVVAIETVDEHDARQSLIQKGRGAGKAKLVV
jgi:hypothetical protein